MGFVRRAITSALDLANLKRHNDNFADIETDLNAHDGRITTAQVDITRHKAAKDAHAAETITYSGAVATADTVKEAIDSVKTELTQAIIAGDSGPEAAAARASVSGEVYDTLGDRLNAEYERTSAQLADIITVNVKSYGALGDGITNDTSAFQTAAQKIMELGGGRLVIPPGIYIVGAQIFANGYGKGHSYKGQKVIEISECDFVEIVGNNATLKVDPSLKYGAFDPVTGLPHPTIMPFYDVNYRAYIGKIINVIGNKSVKISGLTIDGSNTEITIGGEWGDYGTQIDATGIIIDTNESVTIENVVSHHNALDGIISTYEYGLGGASPAVTLNNCIFDYNGRQAFSWVGGSNITAVSCRFNHTGRGGVSSSPKAGVDIEPTTSAHNGTFINCEFADNEGPGLVADGMLDVKNMTFTNCRFFGTTSFSIYPNQPGFKFEKCTISGQAVRTYNASDEKERTLFRDCLFTADESYDNRPVFGDSVMDFFSDQNPILDNCLIVSNKINVKAANTSEHATIKDCTFIQNGSDAASYIRGEFLGKNKIVTNTGSNDPGGKMRNYGELLYVDSTGKATEQPQTVDRKIAGTLNVEKGFIGRHFDMGLKIPNRNAVTSWQVRLNFAGGDNVFYYFEVSAVGFYGGDDRRGFHRKLYSGDNLYSDNVAITENTVGISGFSLGDDTSIEGNTLIIPITHTTGADVALFIKGSAMIDCLNISVVEV